MSQSLPPVAPSVTAELVAALSPRLSKRLDGGVGKLAGLPVVRDGDTARIALDDTTAVELHAPGGVVRSADAIRCGCLLAPACLHRAAAASAAPIAAPGPGTDAVDPHADLPSPPVASAPTDSGTGPPGPAPAPVQARPTPPAQRDPGVRPDTAGRPGTGVPPAAATADGPAAEVSDSATPNQRTAARALYDAAAAVLEAGTDGSGAVLQAELLRAAHTARTAGLPRPAAAAVSVVNAVRAARGADPAYRLTDLVSALRDTLAAAHRIPAATGGELTALRGTSRQPYVPDGSLRLYGLFCEPVLTATGYAGAVTWTADSGGRLYTVSDVAPGGVGRAVGAADRAVRIGDTALTHRELSRAGLAVSGATVSPTGRLGAGARARAVRASGADWNGPPLDHLWAVPVAEQVSRALDGDGHGLLFLDIVILGTVHEAAGDVLLADCDGLPVRLAVAHDDPGLPHRDNFRHLAAARGARLRAVARLSPAPHARALLLATGHPTDPGARVDLGLDRLQHADLPALPPPSPTAAPPGADEAPLHLLSRRVHQAASGGRRVLAFPGAGSADGNRLRGCGLATAAELLDALRTAAAERARDPFGRLLPADTGLFARAWLAAARYTQEIDRAWCAAAWNAVRATAPAPAPRRNRPHDPGR
ncbi:hypothetical protein ACIPJG_22825 [Streptomyces halstedii]|uniref:hypothetical protein n=1 Tax=Streptomyces halstedii TaxID=1944 RepID=UPI00383004F8